MSIDGFALEYGMAAFVVLAAVVFPSAAMASLLTLWLGRRGRPSLGKTLVAAVGTAMACSAWIVAALRLTDQGRAMGSLSALLLLQLSFGLLGAVPSALMTRQARVMPR